MSLVIPIFISHQGCPHTCLFCNQHAIAGSETEKPDIAGTIDSWLMRSPGHAEVQVAFYGGSFTCLESAEQEGMLQAVQPYLRDGRVDSIRLSTRPDCIDHNSAEFLLAYGVKMVELGVQSLSDTVLIRSKRGHSAERSRRAIQLLQDGGLQVGVQLLPGLPGETTATFMKGVREIVAMQPDLVRLYPAVVVKNSALAGLYQQGEYRPLSLNKAIALSLKAKQLCAAAGIGVARMGLQPSATLDNEVIAGPYHPAFGELVESRSWFRRIRRRLGLLAEGEKLAVYISHRDHSAVVGMRKLNIRRFEELGLKERLVIVAEKNRERGSIEYVVS